MRAFSFLKYQTNPECYYEEVTKRILGLPRNIFFLGLTSFFNDFSSEMVYSIFPAFFTSVLKAGAGSLGVVDGIAEAASNFFKVYSGNLSDRLQKRKALVVSGYTLSVLTRPFYILVSSVTGALGLRVLDRVGKGLRDAPRDAIISLSSPKEELGRSFGYHRSMDTLGSILGPLGAYFLLLYFPGRFDVVFLTAFAIGLVAIFSLLFIRDVAAIAGTVRKGMIGSLRSFSRRFKFFLLSVFILSIGAIPVAVMLLTTQSVGLSIANIPLFYMIYSVSYTIFSFIAGSASDRIGPRIIILFGYIILIGSYFLLNAATTSWTLAFGFLVLGLFPALTDGVQRSFASRLTSESERGGALGLLSAATGLGALVAGITGGFLWQIYGPATAFIVAGLVVLVGLIVFFFATKEERKTL